MMATNVLEVRKSEMRGSLGQHGSDSTFFLSSFLDAAGTMFVASPYWSSPNVLLRALAQASTWTRRFPKTTLTVSTVEAAERVAGEMRCFLPWRPAIHVCPALHAKIAIRERPGRIAVLLGSANLTAAAQRRIEVTAALNFGPGPEAGFLVSLRDAILASSRPFLGYAILSVRR
jgi:hypothetical protein